MDPRQFLFINGLILAVIVASYFFRKKDNPSPSRLWLKQGFREDSAGSSAGPSNDARMSNGRGGDSQASDYRHNGGGTVKDLNVIFNYNGHSWDAFEVLGIPAGSSMEAVESAYRSLQKGQYDQGDFLDAAFEAICRVRKSS